MKKALWIIVGVVVLVVVWANSAPYRSRFDPTVEAPTTTVAHPPETFTAAELYAAYEANEVSADQTYGGRTVEITGTVKDIGLDLLDNPYVTLETGELWSVQCFFSTDDADALADLAAGEDVSLVGTVDGLALGTNLTVNDCQIAPKR